MVLSPEVLEQFRRSSHIALSKDGIWRFHKDPVAHDRVQALFHEGVQVREDGEVVLHVGRMWCYVECESVAYFADALSVGAGSVRLRFRQGLTWTSRHLPPLAIAGDGRAYVWIDRGAGETEEWTSTARPELTPTAFVACLARSAHQELAGLMSEPANGEGLGLSVGARFWPVAEWDGHVSPTAGPPRLGTDSTNTGALDC